MVDGGKGVEKWQTRSSDWHPRSPELMWDTQSFKFSVQLKMDSDQKVEKKYDFIEDRAYGLSY